ncbi:amino acid synthesis family protein [Paraburkholderia sp. A2WS-5]|uniref:amino acid synthesis family protein n=1 Tax=Paraburkholderia sp. A2WS-5 TaxID=3028372 RepID=UPI003B796CCA
MKAPITRIVVHQVERCAELGVAVMPPHRQVVAAAVLRPMELMEPMEPMELIDIHAGLDLEALYAMGAELGRTLATRALEALGCVAADVQGYGKAALVGTGVPLEWGAALLHPRLGKAVRECLPGASSIMPSVTKRGCAGACVDVPLHGVADMWSFDHFDTISLCLAESPAPDELLIAVALAERGRPLARVRPG